MRTMGKKNTHAEQKPPSVLLEDCATHTANDLDDVLDGEGEERHGGGDAPQLRRQAPFDGHRGAAKYTTEC